MDSFSFSKRMDSFFWRERERERERSLLLNGSCTQDLETVSTVFAQKKKKKDCVFILLKNIFRLRRFFFKNIFQGLS